MGKTQDILGIDKNFIFDFFIGLLIGGVIIFLGKIFTFVGTIGIPLNLAISLSDLGRFIVIVLIAPITEEIFFRQFVLSFLDDKLENFGIKVPFFFAAVGSAIVFSLFHLLSYGGSLQAAGGSFLSAALMGMVFAYEVKIFKSVLPAIMTHMALNFAILGVFTIV